MKYVKPITQNYYFKLLESIFYAPCLTEKLQNDYHGHLTKKLGSPKYVAKTFRSIWKPFYNCKKIALIPPLLHGNKIISDFQGKSNLFHTFLTSQCRLPSNDNILRKTQSRITLITFTEDSFIKVLQSLHINKARGLDEISVYMTKIWYTSYKLLSIIFKNYINSRIFPDILKRSNIFPIYQKIFGKVFKELILECFSKCLEDYQIII